jgi:hypothetical protein
VQLYGPFKLDPASIEANVGRNAPGVYALRGAGGRTWRVGCADADLATKLREKVGTFAEFKFAYSQTAYAAFESACALFHELEDRKHTRASRSHHPSRPEYSSWRCPFCRRLD